MDPSDLAYRGDMARWWKALLVGGFLVAATTACASGSGAVTEAHRDPTLFVHDVTGQGSDAEVGGFLRYLEGADCFVLEPAPDADPPIRNVPVFPPGSVVRQQGGQVAGVEVPGLGTVPLGDWITGGGGYANPDTTDRDLPSVAPECLSDDGELAFLHVVDDSSPGPAS